MFSTLGNIIMHVEDTMSRSEMFTTSGGYLEYIRRISLVHRGYHEYIGGFNRN